MVVALRKARLISLPNSNARVLVLCLLLLFSTPGIIHATDVLRQGETIKDVDGHLLVSAGNEFALGFFSPGNRTTRRYVGIWYHGIPQQTVVWVANREAPIPDRSGTFSLRGDGTLVVSDKRRTVLWSSGASNISMKLPSTSVVNVSARLLDTGNLIVNDASSSLSSSKKSMALWQMFDHPADTFIPGMRVGLDLLSGENTVWTSWASPDDPAPGQFYAGVDPRPLPQLVLWQKENPTAGGASLKGTGDIRRWRTGQWNGQSFTGIWNMKPQNMFGSKFSNPEEEKRMYFTYVGYNTTYTRIVVRHDGVYGIYRRNREDGPNTEWATVFEQPVTACEVYNACGSNAVCIEEDEGRRKTCECWRGFRPKSQLEWDSGEYQKGGCVRNSPLSCQLSNGTSGAGGSHEPRSESAGEGFWRMEGLKLPDASDWVGGADAQQCRDYCGSNCSCTAYAYVSGIGCMVWGGDLIDVHTFPSGGSDVYIKLPAAELPGSARKNWKLYIVIVLVSVVTGAIFLLCFFKRGIILNLWKKRAIEKMAFLAEDVDKESKPGSIPDLPFFSFNAIAAATGNFSEGNILGKGGFGPVYKGKIRGGQEVAVKRLSGDSGQGLEEFKNEVILIVKLQHKNLVRLLGCCIQGGEKILVYEYLPNRSLDVLLFDPENRASLSWETRFNIIQGIARGLLYLHHDSRLRVIHRDLKASNILLDEELQPKISDFGMARIFQYNQNHANTKRVVGTYGYMSPEYAMDGLFSIKSDVYSFGVLLLEIVSGKRNQITLDASGPFNRLLGLAWQLWSEGRALEFVDPLIRKSCCQDEVLRCMHIGLSCVQDRTIDRPTMPSVILMLGNENTVYPEVKQPTFVTERSICTSDSSACPNETDFSSAEVTISIVTGR